MDQLIEIKDMLTVLGYKDKKSVRRWLRRNQINMVRLGKNTYVSAIDFSEFIAKQEVSMSTEISSADSVIEPVVESTIGISKASTTLLKNIFATK